MKKAITIFFIGLMLAFPVRVLATDVPNFPSCSSPTGEMIASYDSGVHGIVGNPGQFSGADKVYSIDQTKNLQCFCSVDGDGIQTNWWKITDLSQDQIQELKNLGWVFVPSGEAWGLSDDPYMAFNQNYSCLGDKGGSTSNNSSGSSSSGEILSSAASTSVSDPSVLGLAATGDTSDAIVLLILSSVSLTLSLAFKNKKK